MGPTRSKIGEKGPKWGLFWVLPLIKIPLVSPSLDQKEQNCFGHPQFYSSIAPMHLVHKKFPMIYVTSGQILAKYFLPIIEVLGVKPEPCGCSLTTRFCLFGLEFPSDKFNGFMMRDVWRHRIQELMRIEDELAKEKDPNKIFKFKKLLDAQNHNNPVTSIKDPETGKVLTDVDDIFSFILKYNQEIMKKGDAINDHIEEIQRLKDEVLLEMFEGRDDCPKTIPWSNFVRVVRKTHQQNKGRPQL